MKTKTWNKYKEKRKKGGNCNKNLWIKKYEKTIS